MLPERHHWKPAVQAAAVMLRTPPVDGQSPASQPRPYTARNFENAPRHPPVTGRQRAHTPPGVRTMSTIDVTVLVLKVVTFIASIYIHLLFIE